MDALLASVFGLPASATKTEDIVFERFVESFEKMYPDKTHSKSGRPAPPPKTEIEREAPRPEPRRPGAAT